MKVHREVNDKLLWRLLYAFSAVMVGCAVMDFYVWFMFGFMVPAWCFAALFLMFPLLVYGIRRLKFGNA